MNRILIALAAAMLFSTVAVAQHSDIDFSYENDTVVLRDGVASNTDGLQIFEGTFPTSGFSIRFTENPGFLAEAANGDLLIAGDDIELEVMESSTFGTFLTYYDPVADSMVPTDAVLTIEDNAGTNTSDIDISNLGTSGDNPQFIQTADSGGQVHSHIDFSLSANAEFGAYGVLFRLKSSNSEIADSHPVWLVFGYGMSPGEFDDFAIPAFVGAAPIPGDVNGDGNVNLLDVGPFVELLSNGGFSAAADINGDGQVNLLDVGPFVELLSG